MEKLTNEQVQAKADELQIREGCQVHPLVFVDTDTDTQVIGFVKEPSRMVKLRVLDKGLISPVTAAAELLDAVLIKDVSDARIWDEKPENDKIYLGAVMACYETIQLSTNQFKKK